MHESTRATIQHSAALIWSLWRQSPRPDLEPPYSTALRLLDELQKPATLEALAQSLDLHPSTISEYIAALKLGGIKIQQSGTRTRGQATGRKEVLYFL